MSHHEPVRIACGLVNAYLLQGKYGDVLVDTGLPGFAGRILRLLRQRGNAPDRRVALIILTHVHLDHVGNLHAIRQQLKAPVLVHHLEAPRLAAGQVTLPAGQTALARLAMGMGALLAPHLRFPGCAADIITDDEFSLQDFGVAGRVIHTPGHTEGSITVLLDSGEAIVGDLCQNGWGFGMGIGRITPPLADVPQAVAASWSRVIREGARWLHPGHGVPFDVVRLQAKLAELQGG